MAKKEGTKGQGQATKEKKQPKPLEKLTGEAKLQYHAVDESFQIAISMLEEAKAVPSAHLRDLRKGINFAFLQTMKERKPDPKARKKARLEQRLAKLQEELAALES
jgi:hypothetical protein